MDPTAAADSVAALSLSEGQNSSNSQPPKAARSRGKAKAKGDKDSRISSNTKKNPPKPGPSQSTKLRGMDRDSPEVRVSKTISWLLRHGAQNEGLEMRKDGYVKVTDLVSQYLTHIHSPTKENVTASLLIQN